MDATSRTLHTPAGDVTLDEYRLRLDGREWTFLHTGEVLSFARGGSAEVVTTRDEVTVTVSGRAPQAEMRIRARSR